MHEFLSKVIKAVHYVLGLYLYNISDGKKSDDGIERNGGYFTLMNTKIGLILTTTLIGEVSAQKAERYRSFSPEKALRLNLHPEHKSSHESRNPDKDEWGGAIRTLNYILSFSGLPELWDEALMLLVAILLGWMTPDEAFAVARRNNNPKFAHIYQAYEKQGGRL